MRRLAAPIRILLRRNKGGAREDAAQLVGSSVEISRARRGDEIEAVCCVEFRLLYLRANRLERWEIIEADSALAAVHEAASRPSDTVTELWSDGGRIAVFRPIGSQINS
jgi:hypothetical protein